MLTALREALAEAGRVSDEITVIDVDEDSALVAQYDELVPVLFVRRQHGEPVRLCHYFLDMPALTAFLSGEAVSR